PYARMAAAHRRRHTTAAGRQSALAPDIFHPGSFAPPAPPSPFARGAPVAPLRSGGSLAALVRLGVIMRGFSAALGWIGFRSSANGYSTAASFLRVAARRSGHLSADARAFERSVRMISRAALCPDAAVSPPPGCVPHPQRNNP